jgi:RNA polymerase sigma-70 factor (ECF subfamily)
MLKGNDEQLVANYLKGDEKSLEVLIQQYLRPIYSFICRYIGDVQEAEDITQKVFVRMWRNIRKFDRQKNFKTWIFSIAKNASIDFLKKKKDIPFSKFENEKGENVFMETLADSAPLPNELFERADKTQKLTLMMEKLSPKYRLVLFLRHNDHFTFREIAEILGESINTIKTRHRRGVAILKKLL